MATLLDELTFDKQALLAPIREEQPAGENLRDDPAWNSLYRRIKDESRKEAARAERKLEEPPEEGGERENPLPHWERVRDLGLEALAQHSKDLEIATFVVEALPRTDGFAGLAFGLDLLADLVERYWDVLHFARDDDAELDDKVLPVERLNDLLLPAIRRIDVTQGSSEGPFALWHYEQALSLQELSPEERESRVGRGAVTTDEFERAVRETPAPFYQSLVADLQASQAQLKRVDELMTAKLTEAGAPHLAPSLARVHELLDDVLRAVRSVAKQQLESLAAEGGEAGEAGAAGDEAAGEGNGAPPAAGVPGQPRTRDDAFRQLLAIADFFERNDPQSLVPYQLRLVVRRGQMRPEQLLKELIEDESTCHQLFRSLGIQPPDSDS